MGEAETEPAMKEEGKRRQTREGPKMKEPKPEEPKSKELVGEESTRIPEVQPQQREEC